MDTITLDFYKNIKELKPLSMKRKRKYQNSIIDCIRMQGYVDIVTIDVICILVSNNLINETDIYIKWLKDRNDDETLNTINFIDEFVDKYPLFHYYKYVPIMNHISFIDDIIKILSLEHYLPIKYVINNSRFKWDYKAISEYNYTFQEEDIKTLNHVLYFDELSKNESILLEWIIKDILHHREINHSNSTIGRWHMVDLINRLSMNQVKKLYKYNILTVKIPLHFCKLKYITDTDIIQNQELFNHFHGYNNPTIKYYNWCLQKLDNNRHYYKNIDELKKNISSSDNIDQSDLNILNLSFNHHTNSNLNILNYDTLVGYLDLSRAYPKIRKYYMELYRNIIEELLY